MPRFLYEFMQNLIKLDGNIHTRNGHTSITLIGRGLVVVFGSTKT